MVSFKSNKSSYYFIVALIAAFASVSESAPVSGDVPAPHTNVTVVESFALPPIISSRTKPVSKPGFEVDLQAESAAIKENEKWFKAHGGNITRRDTETVGGMTMEVPENAPPTPSLVPTASIYIASADQINNFKFHAALSASSYCKNVVPLGKWNCGNCLKYVPDGQLIVTFSTLLADTNGYVLRSDSKKTIYLVFRGTNSIRSAIVDLQFVLSNYPPVSGAKVHTGFLKSYNEAVRLFFPVVQAQLTAYPSYKIVITGHSLGGAQALLAGLDFYQRDSRFNTKNLSIYTVGAPRVGNPTFAYYVDSTGIPHHRSINNRDIVPHLPPQSFGFLHPGIESWSLSSAVSRVCNSNIETKSCSNSIVPFTSISDHLSIYGINQGLCL